MAKESPVSKIIRDAAERKKVILGVCNGFQILIQMKLLEGELLENKDKNFTCANQNVILNQIFYHYKNNKIDLEVANSFGNYRTKYNSITY